MAQNEYKPTSWNGEPITNAKLNQMSNNTQYIFERMPKIRYTLPGGSGFTRDTTLKMIAGKTPFVASPNADWSDCQVLFGTFFTVGCKPIVTAVVADSTSGQRRRLSVRALSGSEIDHNGFYAHVVQAVQPGNAVPKLSSGGWVHWHAVGY